MPCLRKWLVLVCVEFRLLPDLVLVGLTLRQTRRPAGHPWWRPGQASRCSLAGHFGWVTGVGRQINSRFRRATNGWCGEQKRRRCSAVVGGWGSVRRRGEAWRCRAEDDVERVQKVSQMGTAAPAYKALRRKIVSLASISRSRSRGQRATGDGRGRLEQTEGFGWSGGRQGACVGRREAAASGWSCLRQETGATGNGAAMRRFMNARGCVLLGDAVVRLLGTVHCTARTRGEASGNFGWRLLSSTPGLRLGVQCSGRVLLGSGSGGG